MRNDDALSTVLIRNEFYRDNYRRAVLALLLILIINFALAVSIIYEWTHPPQPQYFAATPDGRIINIHPLSDPVVTESFILQWAADAVRKVYSLDFVHWQDQLQEASNSFTPDGWNWFLQQLKASNNLNTIQQFHMVSTATITGAPQIVAQAVISGHYAWKVSLPVLITYTNGDRNIYQTAEITLLIIRMPVWQVPDRIAINNF